MLTTTLTDRSAVRDVPRGRAVTIGAFDGVHLGHQAVLRLVRDLAHARDLTATVLTFDRHPAEVVRPEIAPKVLTTLPQKLELLEATGTVDECMILPFDKERSHEPAEQFVEELLAGTLRARLVVVGTDFHFGFRRHGDVALLQRMGAELGFEALGLGLVASPDGTVGTDSTLPYSSTRVRELLAEGDVEGAAAILGRPHEVRGRLVDDGLLVSSRVCLPMPGRYRTDTGTARVTDDEAEETRRIELSGEPVPAVRFLARGLGLVRVVPTLIELFRKGRPVQPAATTLLETPAGVRITYADADRRSGQLARVLVASGVGRGDRVALQVEKSPDAVLLYLACLRCGAALLPMNPGYSTDEVAYVLHDAEPTLFLNDARLAELVDGADAQAETFDDAELSPEDLAAVLYTSGTTGRPKGAMLSHGNLASNADVLCRAWGFSADDVLLHALPIFHAHGLFVAINCALARGSAMVFLPRFDVEQVLDALPRCTVMMGVPTFYTRLLDDPRFAGVDFSRMRLFISGSAPLLASTHEAFRARTGHAILERYGMTETVMLTSNPLDGERRPGTVGFPLPGTDVRIADPDDTGTGAIEVRGPNVFAGYWRRPKLAATEFTDDGWFRTGDIGRFDADGYLAIVGRSKDLVISGGLNVYPKEVEDVLDSVAGVLESAVIGVPDADFGEAVLAVVVAEPGVVLDPARVRASARERLAAFKVPKRIEIVDSLPRNAMGKVEKAALRRTYAD